MTRASKPTIVGIDLGTTYSLGAVLQGGRPVVLPNAIGESLTPSAVSIDEGGRVLVGSAARARAVTHPGRTALAFKRDMGTDRVFKLAERTLRAEALSALVLAELRRDAEHALGMPIDEAVVTVPAYFGDAQRQATRIAGEIAGLRVERIINEPTAAAMAYGLHERDRDLRAVVLDLGGGTFDVTVLQIVSGVIEIQASAGDPRLGGEDFADLLAEDIVRELRDSKRFELGDDPVARARVREAAELAKKALSAQREAKIVLPGLRDAGGSIRDVELTVDRARAEQLWQPLLERIRQPITRALRDGGARPNEFDEILLVGGATRMPSFVELAARMFGRMPNRRLPPDEAVAMGAAVQAALKQGDEAVEDLVVTDIAPFSLGIASGAQYGDRQVSGIFSPIIERGTVIPVSRSQSFFTMQANQTVIKVEVYQGEHSMCRDNVKLGEYEMRGLPARPAGEVGIEVRFTYDLNGILEVESNVIGRTERKVLVIQNGPGSLSRKQVEDARTAMARLKFHPRDALPNQTALARADALFAEVTGLERAQLGAAIVEFRAALETQHSELIDPLRERLNAMTLALRQNG